MSEVSEAELKRFMAGISDAERMARAVLLFHRGGPWTSWDSQVWHVLTGTHEATIRSLCDLARQVMLRVENPIPQRQPEPGEST